ncbi:MAG: tyrosine--tRNA ligase [Acidimicrobiales bacterium]
MKLRDDLQFRGLIHQVTDDVVLEQLSAGGVTVYVGFDPTGPSLHLGHLVPILLLRRLQLAGNRPISLAGGGTGLIGDPSFKDVERPLLSAEEIESNLVTIRAQLGTFLDFDAGASSALLLNNAQWLTTIPLTDFLRDVGKHFTVNQMIAKEAVKSRLSRDDVGISFTEFSYSLLQAYDFLRLHLDYGCTLQVGGSDQWGNITMGAELVRKVAGGTAYGLTLPLLLRADGRKFGKSESGNENVWLDPARTSPFAMHQFLLNSDDVVTPQLLRYYTFLSHEEIVELDDAIASAPQERRAQRVLAHHVVAMVHGDAAALSAERAGRALFGDEIRSLDEATLLEVVADAPSTTLSRAELAAGVDAADLVARCELATSKAEARRYLEQGGVYLNNERIDGSVPIDATAALHDRYLVLRRGRRQTHLVILA